MLYKRTDINDNQLGVSNENLFKMTIILMMSKITTI